MDLLDLMDMAPISASNNHCLFDVDSLENPSESSVSLNLSLYEKTWPHDPKIACGPIDNKLTEEKINLAWLRYMSFEEIKEEERYKVSTKLTLYTDPWTIKKEMTKSSLGYLDRLFLNGSFVRSHIMRDLPMYDQRLVEEGSGLTVNVYDDDTDSMHKMVLKKWTKCLSYVLLNGWRKDFVARRALKKDDVIGIYWDPFDFKLHFCVLSRAPKKVSSGSVTMDSASFTPLPAGP